jgi:hypothetical protein
MKHLPVIIWPLVYAFIFGAVVTQALFYLYEREATGLLYVLSITIFAALGYICGFVFVLIRAMDEGEEILRHRIEMLEERIEELERGQLIAKGAEFVD